MDFSIRRRSPDARLVHCFVRLAMQCLRRSLSRSRQFGQEET
jgi:hypothetical protein